MGACARRNRDIHNSFQEVSRDVTQLVLAIKEQRRTVLTTVTCGEERRTSEQEKIPGHYWHLARVRSMEKMFLQKRLLLSAPEHYF